MSEYPYMNMRFLRTFLAVVEERSRTKAGLPLGVSKSNVPAHVSAVERAVGVSLLERRFPPNREEQGRTQLTEAGREFLPKAIEALRAHDRLFADAPLGPDPREETRALAMALVETALSALRHDLSDEDRDRLYNRFLGSIED